MAEPALIARADAALRALAETMLAAVEGLEGEARLAVVLTMTVQAVYCFAIELHGVGAAPDEETARRIALKVVLDSFAVIEPGVVKVISVPKKDLMN